MADELIFMMGKFAARLPSDRALLVGIGAASMRQVLDLGASAMASGRSD